MKIDPSFAPFLRNAGIEQMEISKDVIYVLDKGFKLRAYNPAWKKFAEENNGTALLSKYDLGVRVTDAYPEVLRQYYESVYEKALRTGNRIDVEYECSSDDLYRKFQQSLYALENRAGLIISNHLKIELPHQDKGVEPLPFHRNSDGILVQCSHCRRVKNHTEKDRWDWVPEYVKQIPEKTSHGLCGRCVVFYYPDYSGTLLG